ncbi:hypothetical protein H310_01032 [Aphanomyces invadans]|uniref:Uncharacterized protein n=1 Tax=Aphanomyces invadans TaxID=157072 RepID=A0A024URI1_9STRA|nr:hypothetical protein H310_01032 [Aphanomyces invadans]ETW08452.1 hypothetical protein H310_01032 [Aphanomyces invadans]|eukprot:XP_008862257.1 hypothetical protein H310_01032 [Aphanomyces invadans]
MVSRIYVRQRSFAPRLFVQALCGGLVGPVARRLHVDCRTIPRCARPACQGHPRECVEHATGRLWGAMVDPRRHDVRPLPCPHDPRCFVYNSVVDGIVEVQHLLRNMYLAHLPHAGEPPQLRRPTSASRRGAQSH